MVDGALSVSFKLQGFFAEAKTGMPIPGARRRAWSLRDCRRAVTLQATLVHCVIELAPAECAVTGRRTST